MDNTEERRQTQEVAIARLEVNVEYIKQSIDEMRNQLKATNCSDCEAMRYAKALSASTETRFGSLVTNKRFNITTGVSLLAITLVILQVILKLAGIL